MISDTPSHGSKPSEAFFRGRAGMYSDVVQKVFGQLLQAVISNYQDLPSPVAFLDTSAPLRGYL